MRGAQLGKNSYFTKRQKGTTTQPLSQSSLLTEMQSDAAPFYGKLKLEFRLEVAVAKVGLR